jgi:SPP1 family predicted phage head-tail adaptor
MRSGQYRHKVILLRRTEVQSGSEVTFEYVQFAEPWARIRHLSGREYFLAAQVQAEATVEISIRWRDDVDETCRVRHVTDRSVSPALFDEYDIKSPPMPDAKTGRRELILMCVKRSAEGFRG